MSEDFDAPTLDEIHAARAELGDQVRTTPVWEWRGREIDARVNRGTRLFLKLELFQYTGTFKPRGALLNVLSLDEAALERGVTAVSAGNHALAVSFAASRLGTTAKVVMPKTASPARVEACRAWGGEVVLVDDVYAAFERVRDIETSEGRTFIHPFEGKRTVLGTATVGLEFMEAVSDLDAVIIPVGGGGLAAGMACAIRQMAPHCRVYGVEPEGADSMHRSLEAGSPQTLEEVRTIADSLGAPYAAPYTFGLCQHYLDDVVLVSDDDLRDGMGLLFREMKLAVEPAAAAATAGLCGPLRATLAGKRVGLVMCGTNIDAAGFCRHLGVTAGQ